MARGKLTPRLARFVAEYLVDLCGKAAAIRAGYSPGTAEAHGSRILRLPAVARAVMAGMEKRTARTGISQDRVLEELALLAFSDVTHYEVDDEGNVTVTPDAPPGAMRALQSIKRRFTTTGTGKNATTTTDVELKLWDKPAPLKLAGRHVDTHGFADRVEVTGKNGAPLEAVTKVEVVIVDPAGGS